MEIRHFPAMQGLYLDIVGRTAPPSRCPATAVLQWVDDEDISAATLRQGLLAGGLEAGMEYGSWRIWQTNDGYSGELFQYLKITDEFQDLPLGAALAKAQDWARLRG